MLLERRGGKLGHGLFEGEPEGTAAAAGGGGPTFVPTDDFKLFQTQVLSGFQEVTAGLQALRASAIAGGGTTDVVDVAPPVITTQQYHEAVRDGDVETIDKYHARKQYETLQQIAPQLQLGLKSVGAIVAETTTSGLKYYKRFKTEIDAMLAQMSPEMRMSPVAWQIAHDRIVGANAGAIESEAVEAALRTAGVDPKLANPGGGNGGTRTAGGGGGGGGTVPSVADLLGADAEKALTSKGVDADTWSRRLGYAGGWPEYAALIQKGET